GAAAVAAISVSRPISFVIIAAGAGLSIAGTALVAQYAGAHNRAMGDHVAAATILCNLVFSCVVCAFAVLRLSTFLHMLRLAPDVYNNALMYMRVNFFTIPFAFGFFSVQGLLRGVGQTVMPLYIVAGTVVLNFLLAPVLTFGMFGLPPLGLLG